MSAVLLAVAIGAALLLAASFLYSYGDWRAHHVFVSGCVLLAWHFSLLTILAMPIDVSRACYIQCLNEHLNDTAPPPPTPHLLPPLPATVPPSATVTSATDTNTTPSLSPAQPLALQQRGQQHSQAASGGGGGDSVGVAAEAGPVMETGGDSGGGGGGGGDDSVGVAAVAGPVMETGGGGGAHQCPPPSSLVAGGVLADMWRIVYWSSQLLTWLLLPLMQSYVAAGDFSVGRKLRTALVDNAVYYGSYLVIAIVLLVYVAFRPDIKFDFGHLKLVVSSASNTWGLLLLVLLLGYSLVQLPRRLWLAGQPVASLRYAYFRAAKLSAECCETEQQLDQLLTSLLAVSGATSPSHTLRAHVNTVLSRVPDDLKLRMRRLAEMSGTSAAAAAAAAPAPSLKSLVSLHRQVISAVHQYRRAHSGWQLLVTQVISLEDVVDNLGRGDMFYQPSLPRSPCWLVTLAGPRLEWQWRCVLLPRLLQCAAAVAGLLSVMVVWSEVTFFSTTPTVSLFAVFVNAAKANRNYLAIELLSLLVLLYLGACAYFAIVNVRIFNYYYLAANHCTDQHSLIFSGKLICRLVPPLCLNFLSVIHMDSHVIGDRFYETAYTKVMGHMDVLSLLSDGFNLYWPMCVLAFCLATWFSLGSRLLTLIGFQQFADGGGGGGGGGSGGGGRGSGSRQWRQCGGADTDDQQDMTTELVEEGRQLVLQQRRHLMRQMSGQMAPQTRRAPARAANLTRSDSSRALVTSSYSDTDFFDTDRTSPPHISRHHHSPPQSASASASAPATTAAAGFPGVVERTESPPHVLYTDSGRAPPPARGFFDDI